jgi:hypothetical protein
MAESVIKFGPGQIHKPTPSLINFYVRLFTVVGGVFLTSFQDPGWGFENTTREMITRILGLLLALGNSIAPFFGVNVQENVIPKDHVTAMNT